MTVAVTTQARPWPALLGLDVASIARRLLPSRRAAAPAFGPPPAYREALRCLENKEWATRLKGVRKLASLADDQPTLRQQAIDALCAYLRAPWAGAQESRLRATIIRTLVQRLRPEARISWRGHDFDFTGAVFETGSFAGACFVGGSVSFAGARFTGDVDFSTTVFATKADFSCAQFVSGRVDFSCASVTGGKLDFTGAQFLGAVVDFYGACLTGGRIELTGATLSAGTLDFYAARFLGTAVSFAKSLFRGTNVRFASALFGGGSVSFPGALFQAGTVDFTLAHFNDTRVTLRKIHVSGGLIDLSRPFTTLRLPVLERRPSPYVKLP